jgi:hypothetical protein
MSSATAAQLTAWRQEIIDIRCGWEWAFANGARCAGACNHPSLQRVLDREQQLNALIAEHAD